jgi:hypothetical protein
MKKFLLLLLPVLGFCLAGCSNDFEVTAPWKEIPVVYAIVSPDDTAHYVRVEKAFLDPEKSALEVARIADSLYYPASAITVFLERDSDKKRWQLTRVDGAKDGHPRKDGIFATEPNWLYKVKPAAGQTILEPGKKYRLIVKRADGQPDITAETTIPGDYTFNAPSQVQTPPTMIFTSAQGFEFRWATDVNALFFNVYLTIRYREEAANGTVLDRKTLYWQPVSNATRSANPLSGSGSYLAKATVETATFFDFLAKNIPPTNDRFRYFEDCDVILEGGALDLQKFNEVASASAGITGAEVLPSYTNLSEGFGLFMSKNSSALKNVRIKTETVDAMNANPLTIPLNFRK